MRVSSPVSLIPASPVGVGEAPGRTQLALGPFVGMCVCLQPHPPPLLSCRDLSMNNLTELQPGFFRHLSFLEEL